VRAAYDPQRSVPQVATPKYATAQAIKILQKIFFRFLKKIQ